MCAAKIGIAGIRHCDFQEKSTLSSKSQDPVTNLRVPSCHRCTRVTDVRLSLGELLELMFRFYRVKEFAWSSNVDSKVCEACGPLLCSQHPPPSNFSHEIHFLTYDENWRFFLHCLENSPRFLLFAWARRLFFIAAAKFSTQYDFPPRKYPVKPGVQKLYFGWYLLK